MLMHNEMNHYRFCEQCNDSKPGGMMVIIPNTLWLSIAKMKEVICHHCIEERLGRKLEAADFPNEKVRIYETVVSNVREIPVNWDFFEAHNINFDEQEKLCSNS